MRSFGVVHKRSECGIRSQFMNKVYGLMTLGFLLTAGVAYYFHLHPLVSHHIMHTPWLFYSILIVQFLAVLIISAFAMRLNTQTAFLMFFIYAALTGVTVGMLSFMYRAGDLGFAFVITAGAFSGLSCFGWLTKKDLGPIGSFCVMGLIGLVLEGVLALWMPSLRSHSMDMIMGAIGVIVFSGLTAYDTQRIKSMCSDLGPYSEVATVQGALILYLDFINLFLSVLRFFNGDRR